MNSQVPNISNDFLNPLHAQHSPGQDQPLPTSPGYVTSPMFFTGDAALDRNLTTEYWKKNINLQAQITLENQKTLNDVQTIQMRANAQMSLMDHREQLRINRENESFSIIEDSDGKLRLERQKPDGTMALGLPILSISKLRVDNLYSCGRSERVACISWTNCKEPIFLQFERLDAELLFKELCKRGICLRSSRRKKKDIQELVFAFLLKKVTSLEIPANIGWTKLESGEWHFTKPGVLNMEELLNG